MNFPRYPEYKDSQVEWLGSVPSHWKVDRIKASVQACRNGIWGDDALGDTNDIPCVRVADFDRNKLQVILNEPTIRNVTEKERANRTLRKGNLLLEKSGGGEHQPVGCVVLYNDDRPAVCSNFVAKMELSDEMVPSYWRYVHAAAYSIRLTTGSINQTSGIQNLDQDRYFNERAAFPPFVEQKVIADFLDSEISKIDVLVAQQEKLIELLNEKRQAVISHAVTRGLDDSVNLKDSGVPWLGQVPSHWKIYSIKRIVETPITDGPHETPEFYDDGVPFVSAEAVSSGVINFEKIRGFISHEDHVRYSFKYKPRRGDIYMVKSGATTGVTAMVETDTDFNIWSPLAVIRCSKLASPQFVLNFMRSLNFQEAVKLNWNFGTQQNIGMGVIENLSISIPPIDEQLKIQEYLNKNITRFDNLILEAEGGIVLLNERRTALISAAVTGQIDVRNAAAEMEFV